MTKTLLLIIGTLACLLSHYSHATIHSYEAPASIPVPGGIAILDLVDYESGTTVKYNKKRAVVMTHQGRWIALGGIPLSAKAGDHHSFTVTYKSGRTDTHPIEILTKTFPEQRLTIKNKRKVNPNADDMQRISKERVRKANAKKHWSDLSPEFNFIWPVEGRISSTFGLRRFFNDQERSPHSGLDIAAVEGTPIRATADGTVIESGDFFFSGNMVYIDHGQGLITLYAHMSRIDVKPGDIVKQGDIIGAVGQTGRVTGAHLHFAVLANSTLIDPIYILPKQK